MTDKTTWYKMTMDNIEPVTVIRETAATLTLLETRFKYRFDSELVGHDPRQEEYTANVRKRTSYYSYFRTWAEAHAELLALAEKRMTSARRQLEIAQGAYGNVKGMKQPKESN